MQIVFRTRDVVADLFPGVNPADAEAVARRLEAYYGRSGMVPQITVEGEAVTVTLDREREAAFGQEYDRAAALAKAGQYREARRRLEPLIL